MANQSSIQQQLEKLAIYFDERQDDILRAWRKAVDGDPRLTTASRLGRIDFEDNIPASLQVLIRQLRSHSEFTQEGSADDNSEYKSDYSSAERDEAKHAHEHGFHRWKEGYDIRELMLEWGHLHFCLVEVLNAYETDNLAVNRAAMNWARMAVAGLMNGGFTQSVTEYYRLQQTEAQEIVHGLSEALRQIADLQQQRGRVLREAIHDLRGNLSAVQATTTILDVVSGPDANFDTQNSVFDVLQRGTAALNHMLTDLLDLARLEAGQEERSLGTFDVGILLNELCEVSNPLAVNDGLYLKAVGPANLSVEGDFIKVRRIAQNLLLNAIKYTSQGGVTVSWYESEPNQWCLSVEDTGPGIFVSSESPSMIQELMKQNAADPVPMAPASQTTAIRGEGVGLAIVKRLCGLLDAQLELTTTETGATFHVLFPRVYSDS